jgi:GH35 family endo-1,4-beta-xylanase
MYLGCGGSGSPAAPTPSPGPTTPPAQADPLRDAARSAGKKVGAAVQSGYLADLRYTAVLARHFNYLTAEYEMKWATIEPSQGVRNFSPGDNIVSFGQVNGMEIKGHTLIWHGSAPAWLNGLSPSDFRAAFEAHIRAVGEHFRGRVYAWDVVNEAIADGGAGLRDTIFRQKLGDGYIADAFRLAHQADPRALLFYNDYGGEGFNAKSDRIYQLVSDLKSQGVPIDGVGLQMHIAAWNPPGDSAVAANMRRLADLGLLVNISEMDVRIKDLPGTMQTKLESQKNVYKALVGVCVAEPRCDAVTFWGFTDAHSWIDSQFGADDPLLFDEQYAPKPAFYGVFDAFMRR